MVHISLKAEEVFSLGNFPVTNTLLLSTLVALFLILGAYLLRRRLALIPNRAQNFAELALEGILGIMDTVLIERGKSEKYLPLVTTIFLFILFSNWMGLIPGVGSLNLHKSNELVPIFRSPASDLNFTLALALISVFTINALGMVAVGVRRHLSKFFNFKNPVDLFIGLLELTSEFAKIISFSFRLFGNVFAGEVLLVIVAFLVPYLAPLPFLFMEIFVGFVQAFIFAMLTLVFIAIATLEVDSDGH